MVKIKFIKREEGEWFDISEKKVRKGEIYIYFVEDAVSNRSWVFNVRLSEDKAEVSPICGSGTTIIDKQIKNKTDIYKKVPEDPSKYFHPLGITYLEGRRVRYKRPKNINEIPGEIIDEFNIKLYDKIIRYPPRHLKGKYVVVVNKHDIEKMVLLFVYEKIHPILEKGTKIYSERIKR